MSDMGRVLLSITADTVGWHDPLGGHNNARQMRERYGALTYQEARNAWHRNTHDNFLVELGKHGFGRRDLVANVNFFSRVDVDSTGRMEFHVGNSQPGSLIDLRAELDVLVVLDTGQHPLDTRSEYNPKPIRVSLLQTPPPGSDDFCRNLRAENQRAFTLTERLFA